MRAPRRGRLWKEYKSTLRDAWDLWNTPVWRRGGPFFNLEDAPELDGDAGYNHMIGWLLGISEVTGWSLTGGESAEIQDPRLPGEFQERLKNVWVRYEEEEAEGSPFHDLEDVPKLDEDPDFNYDVGWLVGVSQASGWSLFAPGPREWSPRGWKGL